MKCPNCGKEINDNEKSCPYCGKKIEHSEKIEKVEELNRDIFKKFQEFLVCPSCEKINDKDESYCSNCKISLEDNLKELAKVCECGELNNFSSDTCQVCGKPLNETNKISISDIASLENNQFKIYIYPFMRIERKLFPKDTFEGRNYVSRKEHAIFYYENKKWFVKRGENATNPVYVNDKPLDKGEKIELKDGDEIQFSKMTKKFRFKI